MDFVFRAPLGRNNIEAQSQKPKAAKEETASSTEPSTEASRTKQHQAAEPVPRQARTKQCKDNTTTIVPTNGNSVSTVGLDLPTNSYILVDQAAGIVLKPDFAQGGYSLP